MTEYLCCPCCGAGPRCRFNEDRDQHITLCPVCEVECPCCGDSHPPTPALVVTPADCTTDKSS